jgi:hypothetical protein
MLLRPEDSAQGSRAKPNPLVGPTLERITELVPSPRLLVDQGAGRLRHLGQFLSVADSLVLVDTELQLSRRQSLCGVPKTTVFDVVEGLRGAGHSIEALAADEFASTALGADGIISLCVYDATLPRTRKEMSIAAAQNLRPGGLYFVIVPRNDSSITARCNNGNALADGHTFCRGESCTFFRNYRDHSSLVRLIERAGLRLTSDNSSYRHVWLQFEKA